MPLIWIALTFALIVILTVSAYAIQLSRRLSLAEKLFKEQISQLKHELSVVNGAAMGVGQRLILVEKKLKISIEKQQLMEMNNIDYLPYNKAVSLAEEGAEIDLLVDRFGLPEAEANLLSLLKTSNKKQDACGSNKRSDEFAVVR